MVTMMKGARVGPLQKIPKGKHKGKDIEWVIREDPYEFMVAVKDYLQISPDQAKLFSRVTKGGKIPEQYIFRIKKQLVREIFKEEREEHQNEEAVPPFTEGHNLHTWMMGKDIEEDKSFL